jgi:hypothetical protein
MGIGSTPENDLSSFFLSQEGKVGNWGMFYVKKSLVKEIFEFTLFFKFFLIEWSPEER